MSDYTKPFKDLSTEARVTSEYTNLDGTFVSKSFEMGNGV